MFIYYTPLAMCSSCPLARLHTEGPYKVGFHLLEILEKKVQAGDKKGFVTPPPRRK